MASNIPKKYYSDEDVLRDAWDSNIEVDFESEFGAADLSSSEEEIIDACCKVWSGLF